VNKRAKVAAAKPAGNSVPDNSPLENIFALLAGVWIAISLIKFGNPVIFDQMISSPRDLAEFVFVPWPIIWGYLILFGVVVAGFRFCRPVFLKEHWPIGALVLWLFWQFLSNARSVDPKLSGPTVIHFGSCVVAFFLGWWALSRLPNLRWFWIPVILGFAYVLIGGFDQHHGGLDAMRQTFYEQPNWQLYPKEYLLKMQSTRIFSTLVYPNALAGVILLLLPVTTWKLWEMSGSWPRVARGVALGLLAYLAVGCLYWTGSKGGWLVALVMGLVLILHLRLPKKVKLAIMTASLVLGLLFFFLRFGAYFQKGATSVSARFQYWEAAFKTAKGNPWLGTGPGTFSVAYRKIKPPDAEMAKLTHNDYLEQASDSGMIGFMSFTTFILASLAILYRQRPHKSWQFLLVWLGLMGWALQAFIEFGLYIPAIAWPVFLFFGLLWAEMRKEVVASER
jgi:hypothetical protein